MNVYLLKHTATSLVDRPLHPGCVNQLKRALILLMVVGILAASKC